ncbi:dipeptide-binding ABC transporter, periplasmic substrate-binding component [Sulfuriferula multivorans]|uniref:Dipeptide-binding ABC transporter, periplasmic substrate-binding component n=1 Tax=Sulfuriferula multivorans TaxID=1559896 RepID=A0A401JBT3_9PROT|nr:ABC transporter substrate-binding protein [Sulfuriferula multivorans]GBL45024.1 dipeptide-binding ABC transporter, periplasmic substrate-binding component [Sulfuriferula multivorans]
MNFLRLFGLLILPVLLSACGSGPLNDPYPAADRDSNILYSSFEERPKHLDPARSYASNEAEFTAQIYEPPLQYHYLKRPYTLIPLTAAQMPTVTYYDASGRPLPATAPVSAIAESVYEIHIRPGIYYQPHPAFARDAQGRLRYQDMKPGDWHGIQTLGDFRHSGTRELVAADYVYEIKRLAAPQLNSPILGVMAEYIIGLKDYAARLEKAARSLPRGTYPDLQRYPLAGAEVVDRYTYRIKLRGKYPQFLYWLAMPFFAPVPPEADRFYAQPGMAERNLSLDWYPLGTGAYMLTRNNPNRQMVLERNPDFHGETYPRTGEPGDAAAGLLKDAGKPLPFIDKVVFSLEKETIPYWNKFLQGYYDASGISSDSFDQAVQINANGVAQPSEAMRAKGIRLTTAVRPTSSYMGFNMLDSTVGGSSERARKLRQAIAIAVDYEEYISIFANGRGIPAQGPIPPGIFGYVGGTAGVNPVVYRLVNGQPVRRPIAEARRLLAEAGYPDGRDAQTGAPLVLYFDTNASGPDAASRLSWMTKQFAKLNIQLVVRSTDFNRFQDKMRRGTEQIFEWGWNADYPDPENFLFLLYGPNMKVGKNGENAANYSNPEYDRLFDQMKYLDNGPERQAIIDRMVNIVRVDSPWLFGYFPKAFSLSHAWVAPSKPNVMANNTLKYRRIDPKLREKLRNQWNQPVLWPLLLLLLALIAALAPALWAWRQRERSVAR